MKGWGSSLFCSCNFPVGLKPLKRKDGKKIKQNAKSSCPLKACVLNVLLNFGVLFRYSTVDMPFLIEGYNKEQTLLSDLTSSVCIRSWRWLSNTIEVSLRWFPCPYPALPPEFSIVPFLSTIFNSSWISCKWSHTVRSLLCLVSFAQYTYERIIHVVSTNALLLLIAVKYSTVWIYGNLSVLFLVGI